MLLIVVLLLWGAYSYYLFAWPSRRVDVRTITPPESDVDYTQELIERLDQELSEGE
jgi:hypothetical protein